MREGKDSLDVVSKKRLVVDTPIKTPPGGPYLPEIIQSRGYK
jgi:hypothetical protein